MPTYQNDTDHRITHSDMGYMSWQPGEQKKLSFYVPHEELGLTLVSNEPPAGRETSVAQDWTLELTPDDPVTLKLRYFEAFELSIHSLAGSATMRVADSELEVLISERESHWSSYTYARCPQLTFETENGALIRVKQEERNTRNTLRRGSRG